MVTLPKVNYKFKTILKIQVHSSQNQENQPTYTHIEGEINKNYKTSKQKTTPILNKKSKATGITTSVFIFNNGATVTKPAQYQYKNRQTFRLMDQTTQK